MRMLYYIATMVGLCVPALLVTAGFGFWGERQTHLSIGLLTAIGCIATHSVIILFMIITGRLLREAMRSRDLPPSFLEDLNEYFGSRPGFPAAVLGAITIVIAGVLGHAARGFGLSPLVHVTAGMLALVINVGCFVIGIREVRRNQELLDRASAALDAIDAQREAEGLGPIAAPAEGPNARDLARLGIKFGIGAIMPYFYIVFIHNRGNFARTSIHPWIELSVLGFLTWLLARGPASRLPDPDESGTAETGTAES